MKRALAESYYEIGEREKVDALFQQWLKDDPRWGWGWIGWADCYWLIERKEKDYVQAINILKKGFAVPGVRGKEDMEERLDNILRESGREGEFKDYPLCSDRFSNKTAKGISGGQLEQTKNVKLGRNDPCPCGSGKKYKKCCGIN